MEEHGKELAGYVANGNSNLKSNGASIAYDGNTLKTTSTKYTTIYPYDSNTDNTGITNNDINLNTASTNNYKKNTLIYGDGVREISTTGHGNTLWYDDSSFYMGLFYPFSVRSATFSYGSTAGLFCFNRADGNGTFVHGFRTVLIMS